MKLPISNAISIVALLAISIICALGLAHLTLQTGLHLSFDVNEGWNAYHAQAAVSKGALYPAPDSFFTNNYPPLSFYVVGLFGALLVSLPPKTEPLS